jgi:AP-3 complex subunit beta
LEEGTESSLRDNEEGEKSVAVSTSTHRLKGSSPAVLTPIASPIGSPTPHVGSKGPWTDLDKFYAGNDSDSEETSTTGDEERMSDAASESEENDEGEDGDDEDNGDNQ